MGSTEQDAQQSGEAGAEAPVASGALKGRAEDGARETLSEVIRRARWSVKGCGECSAADLCGRCERIEAEAIRDAVLAHLAQQKRETCSECGDEKPCAYCVANGHNHFSERSARDAALIDAINFLERHIAEARRCCGDCEKVARERVNAVRALVRLASATARAREEGRAEGLEEWRSQPSGSVRSYTIHSPNEHEPTFRVVLYDETRNLGIGEGPDMEAAFVAAIRAPVGPRPGAPRRRDA